MTTPIADFVEKYIESGVSRFHMPGHKGETFLGCEPFDITEITGADVLGEARGIIGESEENATRLFGSRHSFYVSQGSTTAICAMLALVKAAEGRTTILAARNVHKAFVNACALLDIDVRWIMPEEFSSVLRCGVSAEKIAEILSESESKPHGVYLTSPDYLGNVQDIREISEVCKRFGVPLLVDNAHGAYLKFLEKSEHPMDLGATVCCDSAHKTLPVLTGGAYLHIAKNAPKEYAENARSKIALFSSTSPSYLILQSMDLCNAYLQKNFREDLAECIRRVDEAKSFLKERGFVLESGEPLKLVVNGALSGYSGEELAAELRKGGIEPEFWDNDFLVLMVTPQNSEKDFQRLKVVFGRLKQKKARAVKRMKLPDSVQKESIRRAVFSESETVDAANAVGRICAELTVSCPPAVPIAVCGEEITEEMVKLFEYYGTEKLRVIK